MKKYLDNDGLTYLWKKIKAYIDSKLVPNENKVLWTGGHFMIEGQTAQLSEPVSSQKNGIVLVWSAYEPGAVQDYYWNYTFIPKSHINFAPGGGVCCIMAGKSFTSIGTKYVYVNDESIVGMKENNIAGADSSISYANNKFVLRYVLGV